MSGKSKNEKKEGLIKKKLTLNASKCKDLNVRAKTLKLFEENGKMLMTLGLAVISWTWHQQTGNKRKKR